jgi:hypothetical protein
MNQHSKIQKSAGHGKGLPLVYVAHPLGAGADRDLNIRRAIKWVAWATTQSAVPVASWIALAQVWDESWREEGLRQDLLLIERCDEVWLCGPRVSPGMHVEATHAAKLGIVVRVLVDPSFTEGPPERPVTIEELTAQGDGAVQRRFRQMAAHHGMDVGQFLKLSAFQVIALEHVNPTPKVPETQTTSEPVDVDRSKIASTSST